MRSALLASAVLAMTVGQALAGVEFAGVNIAGFDFGCETTVWDIIYSNIVNGLTGNRGSAMSQKWSHH